MKSLRELDEMTLEAVKDADKAWQERRFVISHGCFREPEHITEHLHKLTTSISRRKYLLWKDHLDHLGLQTDATCDNRKLNSFDLAFFGRLLVGMDKLKPIPGFQSPRYPFPNDFKFHLEHRQ